jgi:hypothetical protein
MLNEMGTLRDHELLEQVVATQPSSDASASRPRR